MTPPRRAALSSLGWVALGGAVGTLARFALEHVFAAADASLDGVPVSILIINVTGAFFLGVLLEALARREPENHTRHRLRMLLGAGVLGGYTTYSTLAVGVADLMLADRVPAGLGYAGATLLLGALASWLGILTGGAIGRGGLADAPARRELPTPKVGAADE